MTGKIVVIPEKDSIIIEAETERELQQKMLSATSILLETNFGCYREIQINDKKYERWIETPLMA